MRIVLLCFVFLIGCGEEATEKKPETAPIVKPVQGQHYICKRCNDKGLIIGVCDYCEEGKCRFCAGKGFLFNGMICAPCRGTGWCPVCSGKKMMILPCPDRCPSVRIYVK